MYDKFNQTTYCINIHVTVIQKIADAKDSQHIYVNYWKYIATKEYWNFSTEIIKDKSSGIYWIKVTSWFCICLEYDWNLIIYDSYSRNAHFQNSDLLIRETFTNTLEKANGILFGWMYEIQAKVPQ